MASLPVDRFVNNRRTTYLFDLLRELVNRDIKLRYKRSVLGMFWSLVTPLSQLVIFWFLSRSVLQLDIPNYPLFVFCGVLTWTWFQSSMFLSADAITSNRPLIRRPGFPSALLPIVTVTTNFIHYLIALPVVLVFMAFAQVSLTPAVLALPLIMAIQFLFTLSLSYLIATLQVSLRDTQHMLSVVLTLMFYITPVFYDASRIPQNYSWVYFLNPMAQIISAVRDVLLLGIWPDFLSLAGVGLASALILTFTYNLFRRASDQFVEEL